MSMWPLLQLLLIVSLLLDWLGSGSIVLYPFEYQINVLFGHKDTIHHDSIYSGISLGQVFLFCTLDHWHEWCRVYLVEKLRRALMLHKGAVHIGHPLWHLGPFKDL